MARHKWACLTLLALAACTVCETARPGARGPQPVYHYVSAGDTLYGIGVKYGVPYTEIVRANRIKDPNRIQVGQRLVIPRAPGTVLSRVARSGTTPAKATGGGAENRRSDSQAPEFAWPLAGGTVTSGFRARTGTFHDGIDIAAPHGSSVHAAADGEVVYSGNIRGYGNVVMIRHSAGYVTIYGHNDDNRVERDQKVRRGQLIATVGRSGRATGPNLHFEIRRGGVPLDPLAYLPVATGVGSAAGDVSGRE